MQPPKSHLVLKHKLPLKEQHVSTELIQGSSHNPYAHHGISGFLKVVSVKAHSGEKEILHGAKSRLS